MTNHLITALPFLPASQCPGHNWVTIDLPADEWVPVPHTTEVCLLCNARS